jgi:hypothetical protein
MVEPKPEATGLALGQRFLEWIRERVDETSEKGSIYISIENHRVTWVNYESKQQLFPSVPGSSLEEPKKPASCGI